MTEDLEEPTTLDSQTESDLSVKALILFSCYLHLPKIVSSYFKVATSTPAASTIKAIAATYQKNSSTNQQKQIVAVCVKPLE